MTEHAVENAAAATLAAEEDVEQVGKAELVKVGHLAALQTIETIAVVGGAGVVVAEHLVSLGRLLELGLAGGILAVDVGVVLARQLTKRLLNRGGIGIAPNAQHFVIVALHAFTLIFKLSLSFSRFHQISSR